jgi:hypothetical protein
VVKKASKTALTNTKIDASEVIRVIKVIRVIRVFTVTRFIGLVKVFYCVFVKSNPVCSVLITKFTK